MLPKAVTVSILLSLFPFSNKTSPILPNTTRLILPSAATFVEPMVCTSLRTPTPPIDVSVCLTRTIPSICAKLTFPFPPRGIWQWSSFPGCAMGFFLPLTLQRGEDVPSLTQCREVIFGQMVSKCVVEGKKDVGWRNVRVLPSSESTGEGVVADRGRYLMARERIG